MGGRHFGALVNVLAMGGRGSGVEEGELVAFATEGLSLVVALAKRVGMLL